MRSYSLYQNLGETVFDDIICKPPTVYRVQFCVLLKVFITGNLKSVSKVLSPRL